MLMNDLSSSKFESLIKDKWALQNLKKSPWKCVNISQDWKNKQIF